MATIAQLWVDLNLRTENFNNGVRAAQREAKEFDKTIAPTTKLLKDLGSAATAAGTGLTAAVTLPLAAIAGLSVKAASDFESSFAGVRKTVDATEEEFAKLSAGFREMAKTIPVSVNELNRIGEAAGQLGIKKADILQFTRTMADLGVTTNLTADQAATATAQIQNIFGAAGKDVDRFGATLVALGNAGASTEKDIIEMSLRIAGAGHQVGLSQAQVLSFAAALSSVGINAEAGGSAISRVFLKINDAVAGGGKALNGFAKVAGLSSADFKKAFQTDAAGATTEFIAGLGRLKEQGVNVNGVLEGLVGKNIILKDTLLRASGAGDLLSSTLKLGNDAWKDNTALVNEAAQRYKTFESQFQVFKNQINDVAITLGTALLPILSSLLESSKPLIAFLADAAKWFTELPKPVQLAAVAIAALAAAIGPALVGFGLMASGIGNMIPVFSRLILVLTGSQSVSAGIALMGSKLTALAIAGGPILITVAAVAGLVIALYKLYDAFKQNEQAQGELQVSLANQETSTIRAAKALSDHYGVEIKRGTMSTAEWGTAIGQAGATAAWFEQKTKEVATSHANAAITTKAHAASVADFTGKTDEAAKAAKKHAEAIKHLKDETAALQKEQESFRNAATLDYWKATQDQLEDIEKQLRQNNKVAIDGILDQMKFQKELSESTRRINIRVQDDLDEQLKLSNKIAINGILDEAAKRKKATDEYARDMKEATEDVKRSAGKIFDDMFIKGENVFKSLQNLLKGGALSLGRSIFEDITAQLLGPIKKAFDDFFQGLLEGIGLKNFLSGLGSQLGGLLGGGSGGLPTVFGQGGTGVVMSATGSGAGNIPSGGGGGGGSTPGAGGGFEPISAAINAAGSIGVIFQLKRIEGTMNAVEANTRFSYIHLQVIIEQFMWPFKTSLEWILHHAEEHTNQLDAIYNVLNERLSINPAMRAEPAYAAVGGSTFNSSVTNPTSNNVTINMSITSNDPNEVGKVAVNYIKRALITDRDGLRSNVALVAKQTRGVTSTLPQR